MNRLKYHSCEIYRAYLL